MKNRGNRPKGRGSSGGSPSGILVTAFNSTVFTLVGAYTVTGSAVLTCGAGGIALVLVTILMMR